MQQTRAADPFGQSALRLEQPFHPLRPRHTDGSPQAIADPAPPKFREVVSAWFGRTAMVETFLDDVTTDVLAEPRPNPHDAELQESGLSCLHVVLEEGWEHLRFALRDLDALRDADQS